uniref:Rieske domain-containing protein n=1 Tax=Araucaria cunninghamii TaxID=56994 RepID=A0A0D6R5K1_ARACU
MDVLNTLYSFTPSYNHSFRAQSPIGSDSWPSKRTLKSPKSVIRPQILIGYTSCLCKRTPTSPESAIRPQSPVRSKAWFFKNAPISLKSTIHTARRRWNYRRRRLSTSAIAQPLTSPLTESFSPSNEDEVEEEKDMFKWFEHWYPAAPEYDLDKRVPHAFTVLGLDIVVWWDKEEQGWRVFDDSCPHRRAPLSEGRIDENGDLQCSYHGWCFGSKGECKSIPQAPADGPPVHTSKRACAGLYPSVQQQGIIWFWPSTDPLYKDIALEKMPPLIPVLSDPSFRSVLSMRDIPYGYEILIENLMDPSHVPYAHHRLASNSSFWKSPRRGGKPLDLRLQNMDKLGFQGEGEKSSTIFVAPCIYVSKSTFTPSKEGKSQTLKSGTEEEKMKTIFLVFICVPVAPGRSRLIWAFPRNFALWLDRALPRWLYHIQQNLFLDSDLYFLHLEERKLQGYGQTNWEKACYVPTKADAFVVAFRKWLKKYSNGGVPWGTKFSGLLPPTPSKEQLMDRYWSHVVKCRSCKRALNVFRALEVVTQVLSIVFVGMLGVMAAIKRTPSTYLYVWNTLLVASALICCLTSRWLSQFIYKTYYFHDYNHALVK